MAEAPALELTEVTRRFGDRAVVDGLGFRVERGAVFEPRMGCEASRMRTRNIDCAEDRRRGAIGNHHRRA